MKFFKISSGLIILTLVGLSLMMSSRIVYAIPLQQNAATATPVQVSLPTPLPIVPPSEPSNNTVAITRTPTPEGAALLEAITEANVRSQPDPESERLGTIRAGDPYTIIGRYYRWYQFQYDQSSTGTGWVFDELVNISGNTNAITDLTVSTPTPDIAEGQIGATLALLTQTPGGLLTATAGVGMLPLPLETGSNNSTVLNTVVTLASPVLPTYTAPVNLPSITQSTLTGDVFNLTETPILQIAPIELPSRLPPILPILILGGIGILGLVVSTRR